MVRNVASESGEQPLDDLAAHRVVLHQQHPYALERLPPCIHGCTPVDNVARRFKARHVAVFSPQAGTPPGPDETAIRSAGAPLDTR